MTTIGIESLTMQDMQQCNEYAIALACDKNYAPYSILLAISIAEQHPQRNFDICIFSHEEVELPKRAKELNIASIKVANISAIPSSAASTRHGIAAHLRLLIPDQISSLYKRILYIDSDIICQEGGLNELFSIDLKGLWIAAVRDNTQWRTPARKNPEFRRLRLANHPYFNSGVVLIDTHAWCQQELQRQTIGVLEEHPEAIIYPDQTALNVVASGKWVEISPIWNWQYTYSSRFFADLVQPRLLHFIGRNKPWKDSSCQLPARFRQFYKEGTQRHWPELNLMEEIDAQRPGWPNNLKRSFLKHYLSIKAMKRYLNRFPYPYSLTYHNGNNS